MLGENARSGKCNKKVEWSSVNFEDVSYLQRTARVGDSCAITSRKIKEYASNFHDGHWAFLGPGEESKWYQGYATNYGGDWDLRASQMVEDFENSGLPLQWWKLQHWLAVPESALYLRSSQKVVRNKLWRGKSKQTRRCSQNITRNSNQNEDLKSLVDIPWLPYASGNRMLQSLKDFNSIPFNEQNWILPSNRERKPLCYNCSWRWRMVKTHVNVQRIHSAQKQGGFNAIRINWCRPRHWSSLKYWDCYSYWCFWYGSASTLTEFSRILRMSFDKSWSRKICERNSSSQLWHCELQFLNGQEGRKP